MDLFASSKIPIEDGELHYFAQVELPAPPAEILAQLIAETAWRAETITLFGRPVQQPRLSAWQGSKSYTYSGLRLEPFPMSPLVAQLQAIAEGLSGHSFNSVLLNYYRDGRDSMGMHADNEPELGTDPTIASFSFGAERTFIFRHRRSKSSFKLPLGDGSLLLMGGAMQQHWLHGINKETAATGPRVNLTFRFIY